MPEISWRSSAPVEVTEIDEDGNAVASSLSRAEDLALRTRALGACAKCGGVLTEIWQAGCGSTTTVHFTGNPDGVMTTTALSGGGGGGGSWPPPDPGESWVFCSREHMEAFLAERRKADTS